ncbi:efflux RND transporter periplasmic adaptor subunit [Rubrivirga sp. IMCC43871]|uniref:efflux RND transporter periplasmic adaptor subunit n=1 Tax=Rubrivirga sp. IMCC43871 TaxID=3391575 RepID=UPI00398FF727
MRHIAPLSLLALALTLAACQPDAEPEAETPTDRSIPVDVVIADPGYFEDTIELTGTVDADNDATLSPDVPGMLTYVAPVGTFVRAGQTVAQVRATTQQAGVSQAQAGVAQGRAGVAQAEASVAGAEAGLRAARAQREAAQAQLDLAQDQYRRQLPLYRDSILSALEFRNVETQLAQARAQVAQADAGIAQAQGQVRASREGVNAAQAQSSAAAAGVASARSQLASTRIVAPFSGVVEARLQQAGELASPGQPVVRLVGAGSVKVTAGVPERYAGEIEQGTQVQVSPNAYTVGARGGRVSFVGLAIDTGSRTFPIEVSVENADRSLKPSMVVRMDVTRSILQDAIVVPAEAIVRDERGTSVFIVADGVATRRVVTLGPDAGDRVVLASGVQSGDQIIVSGAGELTEGEAVRVVETRDMADTPSRSSGEPVARPTSAAAETRSE